MSPDPVAGASQAPHRLNWTGRGPIQPHKLLLLGFAGAILIGTALLSLPMASASGRPVPLVDAFFTATSAVCVTGLTTLDTATSWSLFGQLVILILIQVGGLGIVTMTTLIALLRGKRITLPERLVVQEALGHIQLSGVVRLVRYIILTTFLFEAVGALILFARWSQEFPPAKALYLGVFHAVSAFNNAGFDLFTTSFIGYKEDPVVILTVAGLIICGGVGFVVILDLYRLVAVRIKGGRHNLSLQTKIVLLISLLLTLTATLLIYLLEYKNPDTLGPLSPSGRILAAFFQGVVPRTAGFFSVPISSLTQATLFVMILMMFVGASPGSTGGGIKTTTFGLLILSVWSTIRGKTDVEAFGRRLRKEAADRALAITALSLFLVTMVSLALSVTEKASFLEILFEATSAFGTVGLSAGLTPHLSPVGKVVISLLMYTGRVGPVTLAAAVWYVQGRRRLYRLPEDRIMVG